LSGLSIFYDIQGAQSRVHGERGIGRYLLESATALERWHPGVVERFLLNPQLKVPGSLEPLTASGRLQFSDRVDAGGATVYHIGSPFEHAVPLEALWPRAAQAGGARLVVTLYDLIPRLFPDWYLADPLTRKHYETCLALVRRADRVFAISTTTEDDAVEHLGVRPERIRMVGTGVASHFARPPDQLAALAAVQTALPAVEPGFLLYTGGIDPRKNIAGLLEGYAALSDDVRRAHQLVVVCAVTAGQRADLEETSRRLLIADRIVITGFVSEELLVALYQATALFVFPSLYEGFGLPVAEAIACGAPVAVSRTRATAELMPEPAAQFDPQEPRSVAEVVSRCLTDRDLNARLGDSQLPTSASWKSVAEQMATAYAELAATGRRVRRRRRPRIAVVTPLPPQRSGVADHSYHLIEALSRYVDVDAALDGSLGTGTAPPGVRVLGPRSFDAADGLAGIYDRVFYCLGNSAFHEVALELLLRRPGVVIAHDVFFTGVYGHLAAARPRVLPDGFDGALRAMYGDRLHAPTAEGAFDFSQANRHGILMARQAIAQSEVFLVHSNHAAQLARLDAARADEHKIEVIPFGGPPAVEDAKERADSDEDFVVGTFGLVSPAKQTAKLIEAWRFVTAKVPTARLAIVGSEAEPGASIRLEAVTVHCGVGATVTQTGDVPEPAFRDWIARAAIAVQLRAGSSGESSAIVAQTLAAGVPTIVTDIGAARELPDEAVVKVHRDITAPELAEAIVRLLRSPVQRAALARAGRQFAAEHSFQRVAKLLYDRYIANQNERPFD
jgi:glycosyltransferase involved in cell wall biosynthesis